MSGSIYRNATKSPLAFLCNSAMSWSHMPRSGWQRIHRYTQNLCFTLFFVIIISWFYTHMRYRTLHTKAATWYWSWRATSSSSTRATLTWWSSCRDVTLMHLLRKHPKSSCKPCKMRETCDVSDPSQNILWHGTSILWCCNSIAWGRANFCKQCFIAFYSR